MFETLLARLARALDAAGLPYMVIGGQAVLLYGEPRLTRDIDLTLGVGPERLDDVLAVVNRLELRPLVEPVPFVAETLVLPCEEPASGIRDARGVLLRHPNVDAAYVRRWLGVFERALDQPLLDSFERLQRETR